jgi:hypothetical protein
MPQGEADDAVGVLPSEFAPLRVPAAPLLVAGLRMVPVTTEFVAAGASTAA